MTLLSSLDVTPSDVRVSLTNSQLAHCSLLKMVKFIIYVVLQLKRVWWCMTYTSQRELFSLVFLSSHCESFFLRVSFDRCVDIFSLRQFIVYNRRIIWTMVVIRSETIYSYKTQHSFCWEDSLNCQTDLTSHFLDSQWLTRVDWKLCGLPLIERYKTHHYLLWDYANC